MTQSMLPTESTDTDQLRRCLQSELENDREVNTFFTDRLIKGLPDGTGLCTKKELYPFFKDESHGSR